MSSKDKEYYMEAIKLIKEQKYKDALSFLDILLCKDRNDFYY